MQELQELTREKKVKQFIEAVMQNQEMLQKIATDPTDYQKVLDKINLINDGKVPGGLYMRFTQSISDSIIYSEEAITSFSDADITVLHESYFGKYLPLLKEQTSIIRNPIFGALQQAFTVTAKLNYIRAFTYLITRESLKKYDCDALVIMIGLNNRSNGILKLVIDNELNIDYGYDGALSPILGPQLREKFFASTSWLDQEVKEGLGRYKILGG